MEEWVKKSCLVTSRGKMNISYFFFIDLVPP